MKQLRSWYSSKDYAEALAVRKTALTRRLHFVDGVDYTQSELTRRTGKRPGDPLCHGSVCGCWLAAVWMNAAATAAPARATAPATMSAVRRPEVNARSNAAALGCVAPVVGSRAPRMAIPNTPAGHAGGEIGR